MTRDEHLAVVTRLDREMAPGRMNGTAWLYLHWVRGHAPDRVHRDFLDWADRVAPIGDESPREAKTA